MRSFKAFTLIELLIVVAIIAILAAIAVPNFLEAQVRAKVSRTYADIRSLKTGVEAYAVDHNEYPETDLGRTNPFTEQGVGLIRLTTPVSYMTTLPLSPWEEQNMGYPAGSPQNAAKFGQFLWVRAKIARDSSGTALSAPSGSSEIDSNYALDRLVYLRGTASVTPSNVNFARSGSWEFKSVGPNNFDDRSGPPQNGATQAGIGNPNNARIYDPTNGTTSAGDIVTYQDTSVQPSGG